MTLGQKIKTKREEKEVVDRSKRHQNAGWICAAVLVVCFGILFGMMFLYMQKTSKNQLQNWEQIPMDVEEEQIVEEEKKDQEQPNLLQSLELQKTHLYDQGVQAQGDYDPSLVTIEDIENGTLFSVTYPNSNCEMRIVRTNQTRKTGDTTDGYDVYVLYKLIEEKEFHILVRIEEENHYTDSMQMAYYENVLGKNGYKIIVDGEFGYTTFYFALGEEGIPVMSRMGAGISEDMDIDFDGEKEMIFLDPWNQFTIFDREDTEYYSYTCTFADNQQFVYDKDRDSWGLYEDGNVLRGEFNLLSESKLIYADRGGKSVAKYSNLYIDVGDTVLTYIIDDALSDGLDPDEAVIPTSTGTISHREQAYLALEELYLLTGIKVDSCFVTANEYGVYFSTVGDNFNERSFYSVSLPKEYGGSGVASLNIVYKQSEDYSPLDITNIYYPKELASMTKEEAAVWFYDRLSFMNSGKIIETELTYQDETVKLSMEDGRFYEAYMLETEYGFVMNGIYGVYEKGFTH